MNLFDATELLNNVKIENMLLLEKVKNGNKLIGLLVPNLIKF